MLQEGNSAQALIIALLQILGFTIQKCQLQKQCLQQKRCHVLPINVRHSIFILKL
jgi:hypothetical protein